MIRERWLTIEESKRLHSKYLRTMTSLLFQRMINRMSSNRYWKRPRGLSRTRCTESKTRYRRMLKQYIRCSSMNNSSSNNLDRKNSSTFPVAAAKEFHLSTSATQLAAELLTYRALL